MMSTYELAVAFLSPTPSSSSTIQVKAIQTRKVPIKETDEEVNATNPQVD